MRAYIITVIDIPGERTPEYVTAGKVARLLRLKDSIAYAGFAVARVDPDAQIVQSVWTDDAPSDELEEWQSKLMEAVGENNDG